MEAYKQKREFTFSVPETEAAGSVLYEDHIKRVPHSRLAPFAGYLMPLWFSSMAEEHQAVRETAGLFDCTHMGVLILSGPESLGFLNTVTTNDVSRLEPGRAQYSYVLNARGQVLDDIIVYQQQEEEYLVVANAANKAKIMAYFDGLLQDELLIDPETPERSLNLKPKLQDLSTNTENGLVDIALQGPASMDVVCKLLPDEPAKNAVSGLKSFHFTHCQIKGIPCVVARTGYTGAAMGLELLVPPVQASTLWNLLLQQGESAGLLPCGLGARDSLRIEAGLPLYGHELAGEFEISPYAAGYGWAVKLEKDFFIGQSAIKRLAETCKNTVVRLEIAGGRGIRPVRQHDPVLDPNGLCRGWILSSASVGDKQLALAYMEKAWAATAKDIGIYYLARSAAQVKRGRKQSVKQQESLTPDLTGVLTTRFAKF